MTVILPVPASADPSSRTRCDVQLLGHDENGCLRQPTPALGPAATLACRFSGAGQSLASADPSSRTRCDPGCPDQRLPPSPASADPSSRTRCDDSGPALGGSHARGVSRPQLSDPLRHRQRRFAAPPLLGASADPSSRTRCDDEERADLKVWLAASADPSSRTRCDSPSRKPLVAKPMQRASRAVHMRRG